MAAISTAPTRDLTLLRHIKLKNLRIPRSIDPHFLVKNRVRARVVRSLTSCVSLNNDNARRLAYAASQGFRVATCFPSMYEKVKPGPSVAPPPGYCPPKTLAMVLPVT